MDMFVHSRQQGLEAHLDRDRAKKCLHAEVAGGYHDTGIRPSRKIDTSDSEYREESTHFRQVLLAYLSDISKNSFMWSRASPSELTKENMASGEHAGASRRRTERRLRQWHHHERLAISMTSSGTKHHMMSRSTFLREGTEDGEGKEARRPIGTGDHGGTDPRYPRASDH